MTEPIKYLLDADVFIRAKRDHYGFDFCDGFWEALLKAHAKQRVASIIPVRKELLRGEDDLAEWVKEKASRLFKKVDGLEVQENFHSISNWVIASSQYSQPAKDQFLRGADPWLVVYAKVHGYAISSYEVAAPDSKRRVKLPDVAKEFGIDCYQPFEVLSDLRVRLQLESGCLQ